ITLEADGSPTSSITVNGHSSGPILPTILDFSGSNASITFKTCNLILNNASNYNAGSNPVSIVCPFSGTIAYDGTGAVNPDLNLSMLGNLTFNGDNLSILSTHGIYNSGANTTIDLHSTSDDGGSLLLVAGYGIDVTPPGGPIPNQTVVGPDQRTYSL